MADFVVDTQSKPATPAAGQANISVDNTTKRLRVIDDTGLARTLGFVNFSTAAQAPVAATRTYLAGSTISIAAGQLQAGTWFRWRMNMTKTAAGVAASTFDIAFGTTGTTADTARVSFAKPAGTNVIDEATIEIFAVVRNVGAAAVVVGQFHMTHNLAATGHAVIPIVDVNTVSAAFDTTAVTTIGVCVTSGAADVLTFQLVTAEVFNV